MSMCPEIFNFEQLLKHIFPNLGGKFNSLGLDHSGSQPSIYTCTLWLYSSTDREYGPLLPESGQVGSDGSAVGERCLPLLEPRLQVTGREPEGLDASHQGAQHWGGREVEERQ